MENFERAQSPGLHCDENTSTGNPFEASEQPPQPAATSSARAFLARRLAEPEAHVSELRRRSFERARVRSRLWLGGRRWTSIQPPLLVWRNRARQDASD